MAAYRADHVGSFLRPPALLDARREHAEGRLADAELRAAEDRAVLEVLDLQRQLQRVVQHRLRVDGDL